MKEQSQPPVVQGSPPGRPPFWVWVIYGLAAAMLGSLLTLWLLPHLGWTLRLERPPYVEAPPPAAVPLPPTVAVVRQTGPAVVGIISQRRENSYFGEKTTATAGSGTLFDPMGFLVTNYHVVSGGDLFLALLPSGKRVPATLVGEDPLTDLAVLKITLDDSVKVALFGDSDALEAGQPVLALGYPFGEGLGKTVTFGVVSGIVPTLYGYTGNQVTLGDFDRQRVTRLIQTDAAVDRGNSGGPLVDMQGRVVGITTLKEGGGQGLGYAIPANAVQRVVEDLVRVGHVRRAYLGAAFSVLGRDFLTGEVLLDLTVAGFSPDSPAQKAGLLEGDRLVAWNGEPLADYLQLLTFLEMSHPGDEVELKVERQGQVQRVRVILGEMEEAVP
ncbi:MAG: trypsin-like peptidase domain-containing protein [Bacillota bacterium]|nr:trypsin-like peptidase domain-containing protein [Bacillota bacterium]